MIFRNAPSLALGVAYYVVLYDLSTGNHAVCTSVRVHVFVCVAGRIWLVGGLWLVAALIGACAREESHACMFDTCGQSERLVADCLATRRAHTSKAARVQ